MNRKIIFWLLFFSICPLFAENFITLRDALEMSKKSNPFFLAEKLNIEIAKTNITTASLFPNPAINNQELIRQNKDYYMAANRQDWFQLTQRIPVAGQRSYAIELAKQNSIIAQFDLQEYERTLMYLVGLKWLDVWYSLEKVKILKKALHYSNELLKTNYIRLKNQVITQTELSRTQILANRYEIETTTNEQIYKREIRELMFLIGSIEPMNIDHEDHIALNLNSEEVDQLHEIALSNRTDLQKAKSSQNAAYINTKLQEAHAYPQPEIGLIYNPQNGQQYMGTYITVPIPIFNRNQGEIQKSKLQLKQAQINFIAIEKRIKTDIENAIEEFKTARTNYNKYKEIYQSSEKVLETIRYSYLKGGTTIVDYIDAQKTWFETQVAYFESFLIYKKSYLQVLYVTGLIRNY